MGTIINSWLHKRIGYFPEADPEEFQNSVSDGTVLARLLHSYGLIHPKVLANIIPSHYISVKLRNLKLLCPLLMHLKIPCDNVILQQVAEGKGAVALRIFYKLYLILEDKNFVQSLLKHKEGEVPLKQLRHSSDMAEVSTQDLILAKQHSCHPLIVRLKENVVVIKNYKEDYTQFLDKCKNKNKIFKEMLKQNLTFDNICMSTLLKEEMAFTDEIIKSKIETENKSVKKISKVNKAKQRNKRDLSLLRGREESRLSSCRIWEDLLLHQQNEFKETVAETLLKQAQHEKRIVENVFNDYYEKKEKQKEQELINQLVKEKKEKEANLYTESSTEKLKCHKTLDIHKKLYKEKQETKHREHTKICREIIENIIDTAIEKAKQEIDQLVPHKVLIKYTIETVMKLENYVDKNIIKMKDIIQSEKAHTNLISEHDFMQYIHLTGDWDLDTLNLTKDSPQENLIITGYIVQKLLEAKYPQPPLNMPADIPRADIAAVVVGLTDKHTQQILQHVLNKKDIYVVSLDTVIKFCTDSYKKIQDHTGKHASKNKEKHSVQISDKTHSINDKIYGQAEEINEETKQHEENESRSIFPQKVVLGQKYLQITSEGEISDELLSYMIVEYLKSLNNIRGWVLLDYPVTYEQALSFEEYLTGTKFPRNSGLLIDNVNLKTNENKEKEWNGENKNKNYLQSNSEVTLITENQEKSEIFDILDSVNNGSNTKTNQEEYKEQSSYNEILCKISVDVTAGTTFCKTGSSSEQNFKLSNNVNNNKNFEKNNKMSKNYSLSNLHISKILPVSQTEMHSRPFETYFTAFIVLKKMDQRKISVEATDMCLSLKMIYTMQNVYHELLYSQFDIDTIKKLEKLILRGRFSQQESIEEIDEKIIEYELITAGKKEKSTSRRRVPGHHSKKSVKDTQQKREEEQTESQSDYENANKKKKQEQPHDKLEEIFTAEDKIETVTDYDEETLSAGGSKVSIDIKDKNLQETDIENECGMENLYSKVEEQELRYVHVELPESILKDLATQWENIEESYVEIFKQMILLMKIHKSLNEPYKAFVMGKIKIFLGNRNSKVLSEFQEKIKDIVFMFQQDATKKDTVLCKLTELWSDLLQIYYCIKEEAELLRQKLITENWVSNELCIITNIYIECFRLECDRFVKTCEVFHNYYNSMLYNLSHKCYSGIKQHNNIYVDLEETLNSFFNENNTKTNGLDDVSITHLQLEVADILINTKVKKNSVANFWNIINKVVNTASAVTGNLATTLLSMIFEFESLSENNVSDPLNVEVVNGVITSDTSMSESKMKLIHDIFSEWKLALQNEINRLYNRLNVLKTRALNDLEVVMENMKTLFISLKEETEESYHKNVTAVSEQCNYVYSAIEQGLPLDVQELYNDHQAGTHTSHSLTDSIFEIEQLENLCERLAHMSPSGIMTQRGLVYMIQDIVVCNVDGIVSKYLPNSWHTLEPDQIHNVVINIFGNTEYIFWKHLIVYALNIRYPTQKELLSYKKKFKSFDTDESQTVTCDDFSKISLWFEHGSKYDSKMGLRFDRVKQLLIKLFVGNKINYEELLLLFCKDDYPKEGLAKAIALLLGKEVLVSELLHNKNKSTDGIDVIRNESSHCSNMEINNIVSVNEKQECSSFDIDLITHTDGWNDFSSSDLNNINKEQIKVINNNISESEKLSCDIILEMLKTAIPWHSAAPVIPQEFISLEEGCKKACEELQSEGLIYIADFFNHKFTDSLLSNVRTFQTCNISKMIESVKSNSL